MLKILRYLGTLFTELKVFGILPLRSPLLAILFALNFNSFIIFGILFLYFLFTGQVDKFSFNNLNFFILYLVSFGAFVFTFRKPTVINEKIFTRFILFIYLFFIFISLAQSMFGLLRFEQFFAINPDSFIGRASGLSSEPSFFAWMAGYFFLLGQSFHGIARKIGPFYMVVILLLSQSLTALIIPLTYYSISIIQNFYIGYFRINKNGYFIKGKENNFKIFNKVFPILRWNFMRLFFSLFACFFILDGISYIFNGVSISILVLESAQGSWREASTYGSIYGSDFFGPFSNGELWPEYIQRGVNKLGPANRVVSYILFPFTFFSMLCVELGLIPAFVIIYYMASFRNKHIRNFDKNYNSVAITMFFLGMLIAPKWCIYYFLLPPKVIKNITK